MNFYGSLLAITMVVELLLQLGELASLMLGILFLVLLCTVGLMHGANDYYLIKQETQEKWSLGKFLAIYNGIAGLIALLFYLDPFIALNLFVLFSAYHFGEEHLHLWIRKKNIPAHLHCFFYGLSVFALLFLANKEDLALMFESGGYELDVISWSYLFTIPFLVVQFILAFGGAITGNIKWIGFLVLQLSLGILYLAFLQMDLLLGFLFYFVLWHSIPSVLSQLKDLNAASFAGVKKYVLNALPFYLASLIIPIVLLLIYDLSEITLPLVVFIGAVSTIPHVVIFAWIRR